MKLIYKLNLSFGLLLLCILAITATLLYPLLFDSLVESQRQEMREQGSMLMNLVPAMPITPAASTKEALKELENKQSQPSTNAVLLSPSSKVLYSTLPVEKATEWANLSKSGSFGKGFWQGQDDRYIVEKITSYSIDGLPASTAFTAIMTTPVSKIKSMQLALFGRLMIIFAVGGILAFLLSMFITKRLVTPLAKLRKELEKVENRRFSEVSLVESDGEVGEVAKSVFQLARELEKYQMLQKQFFQNASHELKTPLMSIQGYAEGIKDGIFTGDSADKGLDVIVGECERLKKIVNEMILLAKLENEDGIFHMDQVLIRDLIHETVERINPLLVKNGLSIQFNCNTEEDAQFIYADREKVLQALLNIVGNAARYAKQTINIDAISREHMIQIEIADDGEGISPQLLPKLFQRFAKGNNGETGLGLAISRAIVERCHGRIMASNHPSGGAVFRLSFPVSAK